jgi:hypothetical protein
MSAEPEPKNEPTHSSPYIRTFAKDFAALSGKEPPGSAKKLSYGNLPKPPAVEKPTKKKLKKIKDSEEPKPLAVDTVTGSGPIDLVQLEKDVENMDIGGNQTKIVPAQKGEPTPEERQDILARLKARAEQNPSTPEELAPTNTPQAIPVADSAPVNYREPLPEAIIELPPVPEEVPLPTPVPEIEPSPLHTYTEDVADEIKNSNASSFSVLAAEKDAPARPVAPRASVNKIIPIAAGVLLLLLGIGAILGGYWYMTKNAPVPLVVSSASIVVSDAKVPLTGTGTTLQRAFADLATTDHPSDTITTVYVNVATTTREGITYLPSTGGAFITQMSLSAPDILLRNIDPSSVAGIVNTSGQSRPFMILRVLSYERTFSGMLTWESTMRSSLSMFYPLYAPNIPPPQSQIASTSSSTPKQILPIQPIFTSDTTSPQNTFTDEVVSSHDARVLKDVSGRTLLIYGYADKQTLIIARNEAAFTFLISRLK